MARMHLASTMVVVLASVAMVVFAKEVHVLDQGDVTLGEGTEVTMKVFTQDKEGVVRMWNKADKMPAHTTVYKTINNVEKHGKCRFACYQEVLCGGYAFIPASHKCQLLQAPNFLSSAASNDAWHKAVSRDYTGADYEPDKQVNKETKNIKGAIKQVPKTSSKIKKKPGDEGHLDLDLDTVTNEAMEEAGTTETEEDENRSGKLIDASTLAHLKAYRAKLFTEFFERFAHEYEHRAEANAQKAAQKLADKRIHMHNLSHPKNKLKQHQEVALYTQARKEVDNKAVRNMQRAFKERMMKWAGDKMYEEQERLKNQQDDQEAKEKEQEVHDQKEIEKENMAGKNP